MPWGNRWLGGGLPLWPQVYIDAQGTVTVTGRHCTVTRYRIIRAILKLTMVAGAVVIAALGCSLIGKTDYAFGIDMFNRLQWYRLRIDHAIIQAAADHHLWWVFQYRKYLLADQRFTSPRLANAVWLGGGILWLGCFTILRALNRPLLSGRLFAARTTVTFTPTAVAIHRLGHRPRELRRDQVATIQFKVESHPRLQRPISVAADVLNVFRDSGYVVMVYGARIEPIGVIVDAAAAGQFVVCCDVALRLSQTAAMATSERRTVIRIELE